MISKTNLIEEILHSLEEKRASLQQTIDALIESRNNEDKCTVGDKHETGRAMTQIELEKYTRHQEGIVSSIRELTLIDAEQEHKHIGYGSLVQTKDTCFFLAGALGKYKVQGEEVYVISLGSPIGQALMGKMSGEVLSFNGRKIEIDHLS